MELTANHLDNINKEEIPQLFEIIISALKESKKDVYSLDEAAEYLKIDCKSIEYYSKRSRELAHIKLGGRLIFRKSDLDDFLEKKLTPGIV